MSSTSNCSANSFLIGDGVCDEVTNNEQCLFDSGDCCLDNFESKKYCTSCQCDILGILKTKNMLINYHYILIQLVDFDKIESQMKLFAVERLYLDESVEVLTENHFNDVARLEACTMFCLIQSSSHAWTWDPVQRTCKCVRIPDLYHCKSYFVQPLDHDIDVLNKTIFIKTTKLLLEKDCSGMQSV